MVRSRDSLIIGVGGHAVAIDPATGTERWRTKLKGADVVTVWQAGSRVYAGSGGELFCLDSATGQVLWQNKLKGLGLGIIIFGAAEAGAIAAAQAARDAANAGD